MLQLKQSLKQKVSSLLRKADKSQQSQDNQYSKRTPIALVHFCRGNKDLEERILSLIASNNNSDLIEFLTWVLERDIEQNVFSDTDGYTRGVSDGKAKEAFELLTLINRYKE